MCGGIVSVDSKTLIVSSQHNMERHGLLYSTTSTLKSTSGKSKGEILSLSPSPSLTLVFIHDGPLELFFGVGVSVGIGLKFFYTFIHGLCTPVLCVCDTALSQSFSWRTRIAFHHAIHRHLSSHHLLCERRGDGQNKLLTYFLLFFYTRDVWGKWRRGKWIQSLNPQNFHDVLGVWKACTFLLFPNPLYVFFFSSFDSGFRTVR